MAGRATIKQVVAMNELSRSKIKTNNNFIILPCTHTTTSPLHINFICLRNSQQVITYSCINFLNTTVLQFPFQQDSIETVEHKC